MYAPHPFVFEDTNEFAWVPHWKDLYDLAKHHEGIRIRDFNSGFDRNGFFHFVVERNPVIPERAREGKKDRVRSAHYFYLNVGPSGLHGLSSRVLSSAGRRALSHFTGKVTEYNFLCTFPEDAQVQPGDMAMGHYGPWVTRARKKGALTILYGPGDRFQERTEPWYESLQTRGTLKEQYQASHLVIMQAGGFWRIKSPWPHTGLCRWIDVPVSAAVFPRTKKRIAPPGKRIFCFIGLYNEHWKGSLTARKIVERLPELNFISINCEPLGVPNCREYPFLDNRSREFRNTVTQADFVVVPSREDSQPGVVVECGSLGLLPIVSEFAGYVLSFPNRLDVNDIDQCCETLQSAQAADERLVRDWQVLFARYIEQFHRPALCDGLLPFYIQEAASEFFSARQAVGSGKTEA